MGGSGTAVITAAPVEEALPPPARAVPPAELAGDFKCSSVRSKELEKADRPLLRNRMRFLRGSVLSDGDESAKIEVEKQGVRMFIGARELFQGGDESFPRRAAKTALFEVELPLLDACTMALAPAPVVLQLFGPDSWRGPEVPAHCCEINTEPHCAAGEVLAEYGVRAGWLCCWAESRGLLVVPLATDPMETLCVVNPTSFIRQITQSRYGIATMALNHSMCTQVSLSPR